MESIDLKSMGERIRSSRKIKGLSQEQLAELLNITPKFCGIIERGEKGMSVETLIKLKKALDISVDYILFGEIPNFDETPIGCMVNKINPEKIKYAENLLQVFIDYAES